MVGVSKNVMEEGKEKKVVNQIKSFKKISFHARKSSFFSVIFGDNRG